MPIILAALYLLMSSNPVVPSANKSAEVYYCLVKEIVRRFEFPAMLISIGSSPAMPFGECGVK